MEELMNNIEWHNAGKISKYFDSYKVYVIGCMNKEESFIKIGKTFRTIEQRYSSCFLLPYNYSFIGEVSFNNGIICSQYEEYLHNKYKEYKYKPLSYFDGKSECFQSFLLKDIIKEIKLIEK